MSKIVQPFGKVMREIIIKADEKGMIIVEAWEYPPTQLLSEPYRKKAAALGVERTPMDSRYMVLALQKVVMDYCAVIFQGVPGAQGVQQADGKKNNNDNETSG